MSNQENAPNAQSTLKEVLEAMAKTHVELVKLPLHDQSVILRIMQHGASRMRPAPLGGGEDPEKVMAWMLDPQTWEKWSKE